MNKPLENSAENSPSTPARKSVKKIDLRKPKSELTARLQAILETRNNAAQDSAKQRTVKIATITREFIRLYDIDLTYVVLEENKEWALVQPLNFPVKRAIEVPANHLNVFDEIEIP